MGITISAFNSLMTSFIRWNHGYCQRLDALWHFFLLTMDTKHMFYLMSLKKRKKIWKKLRNCVVLSMCNAWNILLKKIILFSMGVFSLKKTPNNINNYIHCNFARTLHRGQRKVKVMPNSAPIRYQTWPGWNNSVYYIRLLGRMIMGSSDGDES